MYMDWTECNALVVQRLRRNGNALVSPITPADRALYRQFFAADNRVACYGNSWTYITQACRGFGLGLKFYDGDVLCSIGSHRGHYVVVRPLGVINDSIMNLLEVLHDVSGQPVFVKKLFPEQGDALRRLADFKDAVCYTLPGAQPEPGDYPWDAVAFADDDTYPEIILDTSITADYVTPPLAWSAKLQQAWTSPPEQEALKRLQCSRKSFRKKLNRFLRAGISCRLARYQTENADAVRRFLLDYFGPDRRQYVEAYENMLTQDASNVEQDDLFRFVAYLNDDPTPKAFFVAERLDQQSVGLYAGIASRTKPGFIQYMYVRTLSAMQRAGITLVNLGGSELQGLHRFKRSLAPVQERQMQMLVYGVS